MFSAAQQTEKWACCTLPIICRDMQGRGKKQLYFMLLKDFGKKNMVLASPDKSLYISSVCHSSPPQLTLLLLLFVFFLCWHVTRQDRAQMACLPF